MTVAGEHLDKTDLRRSAQAVRAQFAAAHPQAAEAVATWAPRLSARCVAAYRPIRSEIDPFPLARKFAADRWALPVLNGKEMSFRSWAEGEPLVQGPFGIEEPLGDTVEPDFLIVPLLAFTREGGRLGYGAGHYDRYMAAHPGIRTVGIAYSAQELQTLPLEKHDQTLTAIATEREWITIGEDLCVSSF
ncbi:MAG: 5-formyltetrahydrofolate cyclo-ligase [Pseudomonadota bacterium]